MNDFDVVLCVSEQNFTSVAAALHQKPGLRTTLFAGSQTAQLEGVATTVTWDMTQPPSFSLYPPGPDQWKAAIRADATTPAPTDNAFILKLPAVQLGRNGDQATTDLAVICTVQIAGTDLALTPLGVTIDLSTASPIDQAMYRVVIIPQVLRQVATMLQAQHLPQISFQGVSFGNLVLLVDGGRAMGAAFLAATGNTPDPRALASLPPGDFFVLLSPAVLQAVVQIGVQQLVGRTLSASGSASFGIGDASYDASLTIASLNAQLSSTTSLNVAASVALSASAGVDVLSAILDQIANGVTDAGQAIANVAEDAANKIKQAAEDAIDAIGDAFSSY